MRKIIGMLLVLGFAGGVHAANISYSGTISTNAPPIGAGDQLNQNGTATIATNGSVTVTSASTGNMGIGSSLTALFIIDGGTLTLNSSNNLLLGNGPSGNGEVDLRSGSLSSIPGATLFIGRDRSTGLLTIRGGSVSFGKLPTFDDRSGDGAIDFADKIGGGTSDGTLTITGADYAYYESLYNGDDLTYNGDNSIFNFSEVFSVSGETLSALPPPENVAIITPSTTSGYAPLEVVFDGSSSTASGTITNYFWEFGDGNTDSGVLVTNTYAATNTYTAWLTVMDDLGNIASNSVDITAEYQPLELVVSVLPTLGEVPLEVVFDASESVASGGGTITDYAWDFGDGNTDSGAIVTNTYMAAGVYTSELVVTDSNGFSATNTVVIDVIEERFVDVATQVAGTTSSDPFPAAFTPISTNDLANVGQATLSSFVVSAGVGGNTNGVNDGIGGTSGSDGNQVLIETEDTVTFNFDTTVNTLGYDITNINTYAAWNPGSGGRSQQGYDVTVTYMDDTTLLVSSGTYEPNDTPNSWTAVYMTPQDGSDVIAIGVKAITFSNFDEYNAANGVIAYREFDVLGTPTEITAIGDVTIDIISGGQVVLSWDEAIECDVWTNANLVHPTWGVAESGVSSPVTNTIGSESVLFYELRK